MKEELDVEISVFSFDIPFDSLVEGIKNLNFDQNALLVEFSTTQSLKNITLNGVSPKNMDTEIYLVLDTNIDTSATFMNMYFEILYSLEMM